MGVECRAAMGLHDISILVESAMRLLLIFPLWTNNMGAYKNSAKRLSSFPPLNLCIMATIARQAGHEVRLIDAELEQKDPEDVCVDIEQFQPDLIGLTSTTASFHNTRIFASAFKKRDRSSRAALQL